MKLKNFSLKHVLFVSIEAKPKRHSSKEVIELLLLGTENSGKSTFLRQMQVSISIFINN